VDQAEVLSLTHIPSKSFSLRNYYLLYLDDIEDENVSTSSCWIWFDEINTRVKRKMDPSYNIKCMKTWRAW